MAIASHSVPCTHNPVLQAEPTRNAATRTVFNAMVGRILMILLNIATGIITARALAPFGRGEQSAMILWPVLLAYATSFGLPASLSFFMKKNGAVKSDLVSSGLIAGMFVSTISGLTAALLMPRLLDHYSDSVVYAARLFLVFLPVGTFSLLARAALEAEDDFGVSILTQWITPSLTLLMLFAFLCLGRLTPFTAALAYTANGIPTGVWLFIRLKRKIALSFLNPFTHIRKLLSYGLPAYGIDLCGTLAANVDQAMVVNFLEPRAMGIYAIAVSVSRMVNFCQASVTMVLLPKAAGSEPGIAVAMTGRAARTSMFVTACVAASIFVICPFAVKVLYGHDFADAVLPIRILLAEAVIGGTVLVLAQAAMALGRPSLVTILQICGLAVTVPLMFVLLPRYGLAGAAYSLLISTVLRLLLMLGSFPVVLGFAVPRLWLKPREIVELYRLTAKMLGLTGRTPATQILAEESLH